MIGPLLIVTGLLLIWVAVRGKSEPLLTALNLQSVGDNINKNVQDTMTKWIWQPINDALNNFLSQLPFGIGGGGGSSNSSGGGGGVTHAANMGGDIGTHQGLDQNGNVITINKTYANMTDSEKDAANNFAHQFPNGQ